MVNNKEKDLVFVYKPEGLWYEMDFVYEMHHLEQLTPYSVTAIKNMSMQKTTALWTSDAGNTWANQVLQRWQVLEHGPQGLLHGQHPKPWKGNYTEKQAGSIFTFEDKPNAEEELIVSFEIINDFR